MKAESVSVTIDLSAVRDNFRSLKREFSCSLMPVVKSDAYGHGLLEVCRVLEPEGAWGFGISEIFEAELIRAAGLDLPLFLLSGFSPEEVLSLMNIEKITVGICAFEQLDALDKVCEASGKKEFPVHLKLDTGMGRYGFMPEALLDIVRKRSMWPYISFKGMYSHLANASEPADPFNRKQYDLFYHVFSQAGQLGWTPEETHMANSSGLIHGLDKRCTLARPGIAIYGSYPDGYAKDVIELSPAMTLTARVDSVKIVPPGQHIGYGKTFTTSRSSIIAVVRAGYDNGYLRAMSNRADVIVNGVVCPVLGNVCMQAVMVDVSYAGEVKPGDTVVLLGKAQDAQISPEEAASLGRHHKL